MSFLHFMLGRGITNAVNSPSGTDRTDSLLAGRPIKTTGGQERAARAAFEAERRGELHLAEERYAAITGSPSCPRWALRRGACVAAVTGQWSQAARIYHDLAGTDQIHDTLIYAEILLAAGAPEAAAGIYQLALATILDGPAAPASRMRDSAGPIETLLDVAVASLRGGQYDHARTALENALVALDLLLAARCGALVAAARASGTAPTSESLAPLVDLGDMVLRFLTRASLASNLAGALRRRNLRADLALSAASADETAAVINAERARLAAMVSTRSNHAELQYRLGLLCRAAGDLPAAARAFRQVLAVQPGYTRAIVRLAVTLDELQSRQAAAQVLGSAFDLPAAALGHYYTLALSTADPSRFDRAVANLTGPGRDENDIRANLAIALAELGLLDDAHRQWKDLAPVAPVAA